MLISDSIVLLWLTYVALSLVVLATGYLGLAFLPRLPRLVVTWLVAGVMWMPSRFHLPLLEEGEVYSGIAPAVVVAAVAVLEGREGVLLPAALLVAVGALLGTALGGALWWRGRPRGAVTPGRRREATTTNRHDDEASRREPVIGR